MIFAVMRADNAPNNNDLATLITTKFPGNTYRISTGQWLISYKKTTEELCDDLGIITGSPFGNTIIVAVSSYYGLHQPQLWEWIRTRWAS